MAEYDDAVRRGHISFEQAEGIAGRTGRALLAGPRTAEVLGYFGAIALAVATLVLTYEVAFGEEGVIGLFLGGFDNVPGGLVSLAGALILLILGTRLANHPAGATHRAGSFTLLAGFSLASVATALLLYDLDLDDVTPLVTVIPVAIVAFYVWQRSPSVPTQLAIFGTALGVIDAVLILFQVEERIEPGDVLFSAAMGNPAPATQEWISLVVGAAFGLFWVWLGSTEQVRTRNAAFALGGIYAWGEALQLFGTADGWLALSAALALAYAIAAVRLQSSVLGGIATVAVIVLVAQIVSVVVEEPTTRTYIWAYGVPGVIAVALAWWLGRKPQPAPSTPTA